MDNDTNSDEVILVNEDYSAVKKPRPVRVPDALYTDFVAALPFGIGYAPMMVNLMIFYLHNREEVLDYLNKLSAQRNPSSANTG